MGIKLRINLSVIIILCVTSFLIITFAYRNSKMELVNSVDKGNLQIAKTVASQINTINEREFKMLESLANLTFIRDETVDMHEKWALVNSAVGKNERYIGLGFFGADGIGWTTTNKWSDLHTRYYLSESMKGVNALQDPDWSKVNGYLSSFYAVPVRNFEGVQIAEISVAVKADNLCDVVSHITVGKASHPFVVSRGSGQYIASEDVKLVSDSVVVLDDACEGFKPIVRKILNGEEGTAVYYDEKKKAKFSVAYTPIAGCVWSAVCVAPYNDFYGGITKLLVLMIVLGVLSLVVAIAICLIVVKRSVRPITNVANEIAIVSSGDADLSKRLTVKTKDEVGQLVISFNGFMAHMQALITELSKSKADLNNYGAMLEKVVQSNTDFVKGMVEGTKDINNQLGMQMDQVNDTSIASDGISRSLITLNEHLDNQSASIKSASQSVTEMVGSIEEVGRYIESMSAQFSTLQENVKEGVDCQYTVNSQIQQIEQQSKMLNEANAVIANIADQTNLLAMNAAIEAAHAGESGKGFAVVADEIRKLSETSAEQSDGIGRQLNEILKSIAMVVESAQTFTKVFSGLQEKISGTGVLVTQIKDATDKQLSLSRNTSSELNNMNNTTGKVLGASEQVNNEREVVVANVSALKTSSNTMNDYIQEMDKNIHETEKDDDNLLEIVTNVNTSIYRIAKQIERFKV